MWNHQKEIVKFPEICKCVPSNWSVIIESTDDKLKLGLLSTENFFWKKNIKIQEN
jgi:hypothetical protein